MASRLTTRLADTTGFLAKIWQLAKPYWVSEERWFARGALAFVVASLLFQVFLSAALNQWNGDFFTALQEKNSPEFWRLLIGVNGFSDVFSTWISLVFIFIANFVVRTWIRLYLTIRWRRWLTNVYVHDWLGQRAYYRMELAYRGTDNPDQRIEQDVGSFTSQTMSIGLGLMSEIVTLFTFITILWGLSGSLLLPILGGIDVPGYMVWVALIYAIIGSWLTWKIGSNLVATNFQLERFNADFRFRLVRVRENAESIALYNGEPDEERRLNEAFENIFTTFWRYIQIQLRLGALQSFYGQAAGIFPIIVQAPRYFAGEIALGVLTRTAGAFGQVQDSLSWFVNTYDQLADWKAVVDRLTTFADTMTLARRQAIEQRGFETGDSASGDLRLEGASVDLPDGRVLIGRADLRVAKGEAVVIQGPSGSGKTTLFRVLAGLWPFGHGRLSVPADARVLFLPQKPYLPIGTLREVLSYPAPPGRYDDDACRRALAECELPALVGRLDDQENWSLALSPGEQQRLAFARAFLWEPDWLFLDEASSALDEANEALLYERLKARLPDATIVSIAHKPSVMRFHDRRIIVDPAAGGLRSEPIQAE